VTEIPLPAVIVLVGPPAAGKTRVRRRLHDAGLPTALVVGLDELRRAERARATGAGEPLRPLQDYSFTAVRNAADLRQQLLDGGTGYLSDATNLRRRERVDHVRAAHAAGLPALALLLPDHPVETLLARDALRSADERIPADVIAAYAHRRSLLTADLLRGEGFAAVHDVDDLTLFRVESPAR
jgi:predicted kinase